MNVLTHTDANGKARMVDVGHNAPQRREAIARGTILLQPATLSLIHDNAMKKGDVLTVAEIAGIQAAKNTSQLIPLCHPLMLNHVSITTRLTETGVEVTGTAVTNGSTGVEMEALTGTTVALLTIYDMCKAVDKQMTISEVKLLSKTKTDLP